MSKPLEIEYKFLIRYPDISVLQTQPNYRCDHMCQMYLKLPEDYGEPDTNCRIRCIKNGESVRYIKTFKESISDMTRIETESEISEEEFCTLRKFIREGYSPIYKKRHSFNLNGFVYEVDVFPFWEDRAYLEIEVESEDTVPPIPSFIHVIKDITADRRYRNSALAQAVITEDLP